jgi:hypothetical protein
VPRQRCVEQKPPEAALRPAPPEQRFERPLGGQERVTARGQRARLEELAPLEIGCPWRPGAQARGRERLR